MKQEAEFPEPNNPNFSSRVYDSFSQQHLMKTLSATLSAVRPGEVEIELPFRKELTQQHGFLHAAAIPPSLTAHVDMQRLPCWSRKEKFLLSNLR